ncbi:MAG: hypothetical protein ACK5PQ_04040 [Alphaproteobacteria bacterium]
MSVKSKYFDKNNLDNHNLGQPTVDPTFSPTPCADYKNLTFFLERTSESIRRASSMIQQLESEVGRLKYELMATENEYKNLKHVAHDFEAELTNRAE